MAAGQSNDPAKILSDMLAAGQEILRKLGAPQTPSEAAASPGTPPDFLPSSPFQAFFFAVPNNRFWQ